MWCNKVCRLVGYKNLLQHNYLVWSVIAVTVVILSRLVYRKGMDLLAGVIPLITALYPQVHFLIGKSPKLIFSFFFSDPVLLLWFCLTVKATYPVYTCMYVYVWVKGRERRKGVFVHASRKLWNCLISPVGSSILPGGDGPKRVLLEEVREQYELHDRVTFIGSLCHSQVHEVYLWI